LNTDITGYYNRSRTINGIKYSRFRDYVQTLDYDKQYEV